MEIDDLKTFSFGKHKEMYFVVREEGVVAIKETSTAYKNIRPQEAFAYEKELQKQTARDCPTNTSGNCVSSLRDTIDLLLFLFDEKEILLTGEKGVLEKRQKLPCMCEHCKKELSVLFEYKKRFRKQTPFVSRAMERPGFVVLSESFHKDFVFLGPQTTVLLEDTAVSDKLLFILLAKTRLEVGENVSVFGHARDTDCIRTGRGNRERPFSMLRAKAEERTEKIKETELLRKNIENIKPNSIKCLCNNLLFHDGLFGNILPKLQMHEYNFVKSFVLNADKKEHVVGILEAKSLFVGKIKKLSLGGYAVGVLAVLVLHKENEMEGLFLDADREEHIAGLSRAVSLGRVHNIKLDAYAINILSVLVLHKENEMAWFGMHRFEKKHMTRICRVGRNSIEIRKIKNMVLCGHEIEILPKLRLHKENILERLLFLFGREYMGEIGKIENKSIDIGRIRLPPGETELCCRRQKGELSWGKQSRSARKDR
ncbi:MAG: uncharacterized protein A8A55_2284 [Amphiamblys sp. WSBS2006]|nr:MAG: uncharacterized protein A8A55_2284 [Amphiamblys sp. WSBS2006]